MDADKPDESLSDPLLPTTHWDKRKAKIRAEIERNRRGDYKVPTWVLTLVLLAILALWIWALAS